MAQSGTTSVIAEIRALEKRKAELLEAAKAEALKQAQDAIANLAEIGFLYRLIEDSGGPARPAASPSAPKRRAGEGPCPICGFKTDPPHAGRAHRGQSPKAPFKPEELSERGLSKLG